MMRGKLWDRVDPEHQAIVDAYVTEVPVKLGAISKEFGISVKVSTLEPGTSGKIGRDENGYLIKINRHESRERQRFTLAHELAHFLLHREVIDQLGGELKDDVLYRSGAQEEIEFEANRLAAELLMPADKIREEFHRLGPALSDEIVDVMARRFGVSKAAMEIRLTTMKLGSSKTAA